MCLGVKLRFILIFGYHKSLRVVKHINIIYKLLGLGNKGTDGPI